MYFYFVSNQSNHYFFHHSLWKKNCEFYADRYLEETKDLYETLLIVKYRSIIQFLLFFKPKDSIFATDLLARPDQIWILVVVQLLSCIWLSATSWIAALQAPLSSTISQSLLKVMSVESVMPSDHLTLCRPLLLLPAFKNPTNKIYRPLN